MAKRLVIWAVVGLAFVVGGCLGMIVTGGVIGHSVRQCVMVVSRSQFRLREIDLHRGEIP
jgi:hypothetical protein